MTWTRFMDMHSGGRQKEEWGYIYIEAPGDEAVVVFYNRFGHNPARVTCTCCGPDYSVRDGEDIAQLTGYDRGCRNLATPKDPETGRYVTDDPVIKSHYYLEKDEEPPEGYEVDERSSTFIHREYWTLEEYFAQPDVLRITAGEITPEERKGTVPQQGYVWVG